MSVYIKYINRTLVSREISQIKSAMSYNNNFFVCITVDKGGDNVPICYINNSTNEFRSISCFDGNNKNYDLNYKVLYFDEIDEFLLVSRFNIIITIFSNYNNSIKLCQKEMFSYQENINSIIYNNGYKLVNYLNFTNYNYCKNISIIDEIPISSFILNTILDSLITDISYISDISDQEPLYVKEFTNKTRFEMFQDIDEVLKNKKKVLIMKYKEKISP